MTIDANALRQFQAVWGPVVAAIPAVLDMAEKKDDMDRAAAAYARQLEEAKAEVQGVYDTADRYLEDANARLKTAAEKRKKLDATIAELEKTLVAGQVAQAAALQEAQRAADADIAAQAQRVVEAQQAATAQIVAAEAAAAARIAELELSVKDLEKREAAGQKALDALRSKLG